MPMRIVAVLLLAAVGCSIQRAPKEPENITVTPPAEDGTRYVAVHGDGMASPQMLARQWKREAKRACEGDFVTINDEPGMTRRGGFVTERLHEGFIRCMLETEEVGGAPERANPKQRASS